MRATGKHLLVDALEYLQRYKPPEMRDPILLKLALISLGKFLQKNAQLLSQPEIREFLKELPKLYQTLTNATKKKEKELDHIHEKLLRTTMFLIGISI